MSNSPEPAPAEASQPKRRGFIPTEFLNLAAPPIKFGFMAGSAGALTGAGTAILKNASPIQSAILTGGQWFVLGGTFWFSRQIIVAQMGGEHTMTSRSRLAASTIAGVPTAAMLNLSVRGRIPMGSAIMFCGGVSFFTQLAVNSMAGKSPEGQDEMDWSKWTPLKKISDAEYIHTMEEKILRVDADIALIDERIANLRAEETLRDRNTKPNK